MSVHEHGGADTDFFLLAHELIETRRALSNALEATPEDLLALRGSSLEGNLVLLNMSAKHFGVWQITQFDVSGTPTGDIQYTNKTRALSDFLRELDVSTLTDYNGVLGLSIADEPELEISRDVPTEGQPPRTRSRLRPR
jgi:hypothetical protein